MIKLISKLPEEFQPVVFMFNIMITQSIVIGCLFGLVRLFN